MKKAALLLLCTLPFLFTGCKKPTIACMNLEIKAASTGTEVEFISCSENALSYEWFITGPPTAPENILGWSDPVFSNIFTVPGEYTIMLNAYSDFSFTGEKATIYHTTTIP